MRIVMEDKSAHYICPYCEKHDFHESIGRLMQYAQVEYDEGDFSSLEYDTELGVYCPECGHELTKQEGELAEAAHDTICG